MIAKDKPTEKRHNTTGGKI